MNLKIKRLMFASDYQEGAHPHIINRLTKTNLLQTSGYGTDEICQSAKERIRKACQALNAQVEFLVGGTQANATMIDAFLTRYQGVIAADSGHVNVHEAGAIEFCGHKVMALPGTLGKITAAQIKECLDDFYADDNHEHMVMPGMVYLSQPTEYGTLYSKKELTEISLLCREKNIPLYVDGARLAYALASPANDVTLADLASLCDAFYIGGTKCGALFGEAVVIKDPERIPHMTTIIKQHGALLAKGRLLGIQFDELFQDDIYLHIGENAICYAEQIKEALKKAGLPLYLDAPTNQVFFVIENEKMKELGKRAEYAYMQKQDATHSVIRFATSWATTADDVNELRKVIDAL